jgi:hypothetical protein
VAVKGGQKRGRLPAASWRKGLSRARLGWRLAEVRTEVEGGRVASLFPPKSRHKYSVKAN